MSMSSIATEICWLFVDDSNIWIEAQKAAAAGNTHLPKLTDRDRDPRLRINIGKLADRLCKNRTRGLSSLYGSRPPPNDSVWAAFKQFNFELHIFNKNLRNKEKEVDTEMAADLVERATELRVGAKSDDSIREQKKNSIFIVITGDRDMIPPIRKVLCADIRVELWGWKHGIAKDYYRLVTEYPGLLSVYHLESEAANIFFTKTKSSRQGKPDPLKTVVIRGDPVTELNEDGISEELSQLQLLFYTNTSESKTMLFVEFPMVPDIETVLLRLRGLLKGRCTVVSWPEYAHKAENHTEVALELRNKYTPLGSEDSTDSSSEPRTADGREGRKWVGDGDINSQPRDETGDEGGDVNLDGDSLEYNNRWETVSRSDPAKDHRRRLRQKQQCSDGVRCYKAGDCGYSHTPEEKKIFESYPGRDMRWWKTKKCILAGCRRGTRCSFAHTNEESWCLGCKVLGHCVDNCRWNTGY